MTRERIVNVLGVLGAIFCLMAVLTGFGHVPDDGAAPATPAPAPVAPAPGAVPQAPAQSGAPAAPAAPSPAPKAGDDDG